MLVSDNGSRKSITQASAPVDLDSDSSITRDKAAISRSTVILMKSVDLFILQGS